jgi:hypothetical protein
MLVPASHPMKMRFKNTMGGFNMREFVSKYFKGGVTRIPKEKERTFFFYATIVFIVIYLLHRFFGDSWFK